MCGPLASSTRPAVFSVAGVVAVEHFLPVDQHVAAEPVLRRRGREPLQLQRPVFRQVEDARARGWSSTSVLALERRAVAVEGGRLLREAWQVVASLR